MNWSDIKRSLDSEFKRLEEKRIKDTEDDEKLAEFIDQHVWCNECHCVHPKPACDDPESKGEWKMAIPKEIKELESKSEKDYWLNENNKLRSEYLKLENEPRIVAVVKGSSVPEFKQNWKEKVEAN